jgi:hypothetical protein
MKMFDYFVENVVPRFYNNGVEFTVSEIIDDGKYMFVDSSISVTRQYNDQEIIWATLKLRLLYNTHNNFWSAHKIWEFLVDPVNDVINTYKTVICKDVNFQEAVWDLTSIMKLNIADLADFDSYGYSINYCWPEHHQFDIDNIEQDVNNSLFSVY